MFISEKGLSLIKQFEGCILQSYDDCNDRKVYVGDSWQGTLTIGWGHIENVFAGQVISQSVADIMLVNDMQEYCRQVDEAIQNGAFGFEINQNMYDALVSFCYNLGQNCLYTLGSNGSRSFNDVVNMWCEYRNKGSQWEQGLLNRRRAELSLFLSSEEGEQSLSTPALPNEELRRLQHELNIQGFKDENGNKLSEDGYYGKLTLSACPLLKHGCCGNITQWVQLRIGVTPDGDFGNNTDDGVIYFQQSRGLKQDAIVGKDTWRELLKSV